MEKRFTLCLKPRHANFQRSSARETFSKLGLNRGGKKNVQFLTENWPYLGNGKIEPSRLLLITNRPRYSGGSGLQNMGARPHGERGIARANNGGLAAEPPAGSRGKASRRGSRGRSRPEAEALLVFGRAMKAANLLCFLNFGNAKNTNLCYICKKLSVATKLGEGWSKTGGGAVTPAWA